MEECLKCGGREVVEQDGKLHECVCSFIKRVAASMPPYVRKAEVLPEHLRLPIVKAVDQSVYVVAAWSDMKAVIKTVMLKHPNKLIRVTSDAEIRDVFVGSKSKASKSADYDGEIFNNLQDLMDPPDLMIVRLNEMAYKNKAAAGALEEALSYRLDRDKPTWVLSNVDKRFVQGSFSYSDSVAELLSTGYFRMNIERISRRPSVDDELFVDPVGTDPLPDVGAPGERPSQPLQPPKPKRRRQKRDEEDLPVGVEAGSALSRYGGGIDKPKRFGGRS